MHVAIVLLSLASVAPVVVDRPARPTLDDIGRAEDTGRTLRRVEGYRRAGDYQRAADELRGWRERWAAGASTDIGAEADRMLELMGQMVAMQEAQQRAHDDPVSARRYLELVVRFAEPTSKSVEQARALRLLARHDAKVAALLDAAFPARLEVTGEIIERGELMDPDLFVAPMQSALVQLSREALPIVRGSQAGASTLHMRLTVRENDRRNSLLEGTAMHSWAVNMTGSLVGADGVELLRVGTTLSALGINPGWAARSGCDRVAARFYESLIDELAKRAAMGEL